MQSAEFLAEELFDIQRWFERSCIKFEGNVLVRGASGFIGQWVYAALKQISSRNNQFKVDAQTSRPDLVSTNWGKVIRTPLAFSNETDNQYSLIYDLALPVTGGSREEQLGQALHFHKNILKCFFQSETQGRIVHPSSGAVYGDLRYSESLCEDSLSESRNLSIYGEAKKNIEELSCEIQNLGRNLITPRIFTVFGPLMRDDSPLVGNVFIKSAAKGESINARVSRNVFRDFMYITDLVKQLIYVGMEGTSTNNVNLGSNNVYDVEEFGKLVAKAAGVRFIPGVESELIDNYYGCLHRLNLLMGDLQDNNVPIEKAISKTLFFYQKS